MLENLLRIYVVIGLVAFGLRGVLYEVGVPGWLLLISLALAGGLLFGIDYLVRKEGTHPAGLVRRGHDFLLRHHLISH